MNQIACSTTLCPLPCTTSEILNHWSTRCSGVTRRMSIDARIGPDQQRDLLSACPGTGTLQITSTELSHPYSGPGGRPAPSLASPDPDEQREARAQLTATLQRGHHHGVRRVLIPPVGLELPLSWSTLALRFATARQLELEALKQQRELRRPVALDALCLVLDPMLRIAEDLESELVLLTPSPWPHLFPSDEEVARLQEIFAGAPLFVRHCTDWAHAGGVLGWVDRDRPMGQATSVQLADASGLVLELPLGCGEIVWHEQEQTVQVEGEMVLSFRPDTCAVEVQMAWMLLGRLLQGQTVADADLLEQGSRGGFEAV